MKKSAQKIKRVAAQKFQIYFHNFPPHEKPQTGAAGQWYRELSVRP